MALPKKNIAVRPESEPKLCGLAERLVKEADAVGLLPTPLERLFEIAKVTNIDELPDESFFRTLPEKTKSFFKSAMQKIRGIADLRERATYVPRDSNTSRERFAKAHELGHQVIPWHEIDPAYLDDAESLGADAKLIFEQEASFFGAEVIFQGRRFRTRSRDYQPNFEAIFELSDQHGASKQATAWRFVEEQDEAVALLQYYPSYALDEEGNTVLNIWRSIGSPSFIKKYCNTDAPRQLRTGHSWTAARDIGRVCDGTEKLSVDGIETAFQWHAWWNGYALLVLLRHKPRLSIVGQVLRGL